MKTIEEMPMLDTIKKMLKDSAIEDIKEIEDKPYLYDSVKTIITYIKMKNNIMEDDLKKREV